MNKEDNYSTNEYWYKRLLRSIKDLDKSLTNYLVEDRYHYENIEEENVISEIKRINDITNFILDKIKQELEENEQEYDNFYTNYTKQSYEIVKDIHNAWKSMEFIKTKLDEEQYKNISISWRKGFDFGFGNSNYCNLEIYTKESNDGCTTYKQIISTTTHNGETFNVYVADEYIKNIENKEDKLDKWQISNKQQEYTKRNIDSYETIDYLKELILEILKGDSNDR